MAKQQVQKKALSQSNHIPNLGLYLQTRPFASSDSMNMQQQTAPSNQVQAKPTSNFSHNFGNLNIQPKLTIGQPDDKYEQEADRVAAQVVQQLSTSGTSINNKKLVQRQEMPDEEELQMKPVIQRQAGRVDASTQLESSINQARGGGQALASSIRQPMEQAFGADFSSVRIHTDSQSDQLNHSIQAKAFTTGQDIFFRQGAYNPGNKSGQELLAHELTHVVQQNTGAIQRRSIIQRDFEHQALAGKKAETKSEQVTTGAGSVTTTEKSAQGLAGAEAAAKLITEASDESVKKAFDAMARAGAFGEVSAKKAVERGSLSYGAEGSASGMAGAQAQTQLSVEVKNVIEGITILAEASASAGIGGELSGRLYAAAGPLAAELKAKINAFAGVMAEAKGEFKIGLLTGLMAEGSVKVMAGAKSEGEVTGIVSAGDLGIEGNGQYEALAGAEAGAEGKLKISLTGIEASGKAECFAGAKVKTSGSASTTYKGKILVKISGEVEACAGVGGSVEGEFSFADGKLKIQGKLATVLGIGAGLGAGIEIDFKEIGLAIVDIVKRAVTTKAKINRLSLADDERTMMPQDKAAEMNKKLYNAVFPHFEAYAKKKRERVAKGKAKNFVKGENIQEIIDKKILKNTELSELVKYKESDLVLTQAAYDAFGDQLDNGGFVIQAGIIRGFNVKKAPPKK